MASIKTNLHVYPSPIEYESRLLKETSAIKNAGVAEDVTIVGTSSEGLPACESLPSGVEIIRVRSFFSDSNSLLGKALRLITWQIQVYLKFGRAGVGLVNCHCLSVLPLGVMFKLLSGCRLIYDPHELETETVGSVGLRKTLAKWVERRLIPFADATIVVSDSIADWYKTSYRLNNVSVVKNVPEQRNGHSPIALKKKLSIPDSDILFLYQGVMGVGRGIELILRVFSTGDRNKHVLFLGYGDLVDLVKKFSNDFPNIHYHPAVPPVEVHRYTAGADVGLSLGENICLSYYLSLPNKIYEYLMAGLAVIASDFPEFSRVLQQSNSGWIVQVNDVALARCIEEITLQQVFSKRQNARAFSETIGWHAEGETLLRVVRGLVPTNGINTPELEMSA